MPTLKEAKDKVRELAQKALDVTESKTLTTAEMKTALNGEDGKTGLEADIKHWEAEVKSLEYVEAKRAQFTELGDQFPVNGMTMDDSKSFNPGRGNSRPDVKALGRAPGLDIDERDAHAMFTALKNAQAFKIDLKSAGSDAGNTTAGQLNSEMRPGILALRSEPVRILDYIPSTATSSDAVSWITHTSTTGTAGMVAAGELKPEAFPNTLKATLFMRKIAVYAVENEETLEDFSSFTNFLEVELRRLIISAENTQLLSGDNLGENILGLLNVSGVLTRAKAADTYLDCMEQGIADLRTGSAYAEPDSIIIHPSTWSLIRREKTTTGEYLLAENPSSKEADNLWGVPVLPTTDIPVGTALMSNLAMAAEGIIRRGITVRASNSSNDSFQRNQTAFVAEERLNLGINYPAAMLKITGLV